MLNDRQKVKQIIKTLRLAAKRGDLIRFKQDRDFPDNFFLETDKGMQVLNTLFLYKSRQKVVAKI